MSTSTASTPLPEWTCGACRASDDVVIELQDLDGDMVCPRCATVDPIATSAVSHLDVNDVTGQIVTSVNTLRDMETTRKLEGDKRERRFIRHVDAMIKTNLSQIFGQSNFNLENGARLWFNKVREVDMQDRGLSQLTTLTVARRLPYLVALSTRMAVQESILIPIYNRLKDPRRETAGAVRNYTKGDDRLFTMTLNDMLIASQKLSGHDPARLTNLDTLQFYDKHLSRELGSGLTMRDEVLCTVKRAMVIVQELAQADSSSRKRMLQCEQKKVGWPADPLDRLQRISDWDDVLHIANGLYQAQACVSLFPEPARYKIPAVHAIVLVSTAIQIVIGETLKNFPQVEAELSVQLKCYRPSVTKRLNELERLILAWSTSIPEAGLPVPQLKMPKRTTQMGDGLSGWDSDKRRSIPFTAIVPKAGRVIAENWQAIKRVRLKRPAVLPFEDELALTRKMLIGTDIASELQALLRKHTVQEAEPSRSASPAKSDSFSDRAFSNRSESHVNEIEQEERVVRLPPPSGKITRMGRYDEVRQWIEEGDDSSDDEGSGSTDDEDPRPISKRPRLSDRRQEIGQLPRPFAFSIGPKGFDIDRSDSAQSLSVGNPLKRVESSSGTVDSSFRGQSVDSGPSEGLTLASESCQMVRQPSGTPSTASSTVSSTLSPSTPRSLSMPHPQTARSSPAPSSSIKASTISRAAQLRAVQRGLLDEMDHVGVLVREKAELGARDTRVPKPTAAEPRKAIEPNVLISINLWLDQQLERGTIPRRIEPAHLEQLGLPGGRVPSDITEYLASQAKYRSNLETLLRIGISPHAIPVHLVPQSTCGVNLDLYHYRHRDAILGIGDDKDSPEVQETALRLFFRGHGNDDPRSILLKENEIKERIQDYLTKGFWDVLEDSSPVPRPARRRRRIPAVKAEPDNMIQRIAYEYEHDAVVAAGDQDAETEMIQKAVLAGLIRVQQKPRWDAYKDTATVPRLWYNDDLSILRLVPQTKISFADASALTDSIWGQWKEQEREGNVDMPPPSR